MLDQLEAAILRAARWAVVPFLVLWGLTVLVGLWTMAVHPECFLGGAR